MRYRRRGARPTTDDGDGHDRLDRPQRALLVGVKLDGQDAEVVEEHLDELGRLTETAGGSVVGRRVQARRQIDPATYVGRGVAEEIASLARETRADLAVFDDDLSPAQIRNLEEALGVRVVDRSSLILDIFARRARSREAKTQVELARLRHLLPRLRGGWTHLSRQEGGIGVRGGIGETQIELDRRLLRARIHRLEEALARIEAERLQRRAGRAGAVKVALVGYTNAGKTTLFNALTSASAFVEDRLFATLDPLVRRVKLPRGREILLIDTVGFIRKLPHHLVASFRSTLEEAADADLLLHVADASHPDHEEQMLVTEQVLAELGMETRPVQIVLNKSDLLDEGAREREGHRHPEALLAAAATGAGIEALLDRIEGLLHRELIERSLRVRSSDRDAISRIHALAEVLSMDWHEGYVDIRVRTSRARAHVLEAGLAPGGA